MPTPREVKRKALLQLSNEDQEYNEIDDKEDDIQKPDKIVPIVIHLFGKQIFIFHHICEHHDLKKHESNDDKAKLEI